MSLLYAWALAFGLLAIHGFLALRLLVSAMTGFAIVSVDGRRLLSTSPFWTEVLGLADQMLSGDVHVQFVVPVLVWLAVSLRSPEWAALRAGAKQASRPNM